MKRTCLASQGDLHRSIQLTNQLEKSLKRLAGKARKGKHNGIESSIANPDQVRMAEEIKSLREQKQQLFCDNQFLTQEVMKFKQEIEDLNKQISQLKKYVHFLQSYNKNLKQEMGFWIKKPKQHTIDCHGVDPTVLQKEIEHLRRMNDFKESELRLIERTNQAHTQPNHTPTKPTHKKTPKKPCALKQPSSHPRPSPRPHPALSSNIDPF